MPKLNDRFKVPSIPIFWTYGKTRIEWRPAQATFYDWVKAVHAFCTGNGINPLPTEEQLETLACQQIPSSYCNGTQRHVVQRQSTHVVGRSSGCSACGRRH